VFGIRVRSGLGDFTLLIKIIVENVFSKTTVKIVLTSLEGSTLDIKSTLESNYMKNINFDHTPNFVGVQVPVNLIKSL
jgi:hypothetical protein